MNHKYKYVLFVRHPLHQYVSSKLYESRHTQQSFNATVVTVKAKGLRDHRYGNVYEGYAKYFLTPDQKKQVYSNGAGHKERKTYKQQIEQRIELMMHNLIELPVVVGYVKRLPQSLAMIQHLVPRNQQLNSSFNSSQKQETRIRRQNRSSFVLNETKLSTSAIVNELLGPKLCTSTSTTTFCSTNLQSSS